LTVVGALGASGKPELMAMGQKLGNALKAWTGATEWLAANVRSNLSGVMTAAVPYLHLAVTVTGGWLMAKSAAIAAERLAAGSSDNFYRAKLVTAEYFATHQLPFAPAHASEVTGGAPATLGLPEGLF